ncbi:MAG: hypothetical protein L6R40_004909 [Gallowayella cf. fulva]|nr:MAG: hypothetical protein L6R40_004909 [Xanthomendoza cf. fulva]
MSNTVHGDFSTLDPRNITEAVDLQFTLETHEYPGQPRILFINGTNGDVEVTPSIHSPIPYVAIAGYLSFSQATSDSGCPAGQVRSKSTCGCLMTSGLSIDFARDSASFSDVDLKETYYSVITPRSKNTLEDELWRNTRTMDVAPFSEWLLSVESGNPDLKSCFFVPGFVGPPALKVPVSALTATVTTTVRGTEQYSWTAATPASRASNPVAAETSKADPDMIDKPTMTPDAIPDVDPSDAAAGVGGIKGFPTPTLASPPRETVSDGSTYIPGPSSEYLAASAVLTHGEKSKALVSTVAMSENLAAHDTSTLVLPEQSTVEMPLVSFLGSVSGYLAASALPTHGEKSKALVSTVAISDNIAAHDTSTQVLPEQSIVEMPFVSFLGSVYTLDTSSNFVYQEQTVTPGGTATISGSVASVPAIGGTSTLSLPDLTSITTPVLSFLGSTYTMDKSSGFILAGQTIKPGVAVTVSGSVISMVSGGSLAVQGSITQTLSQATITVARDGPVGSSSTTTSASEIVVDGTILAGTGLLTEPRAPTSVAGEGSDTTDGVATTGSLGEATASAILSASGPDGPPVRPGDGGEAQSAAGVGKLRLRLLAVVGASISAGLIVSIL